MTGRTMGVHQQQDLCFRRYAVEDAKKSGPRLGLTDILRVFVEAKRIPKRVLPDKGERTKSLHRINRHMCPTRNGHVDEKPETRKHPDGAIRRAVKARMKAGAA